MLQNRSESDICITTFTSRRIWHFAGLPRSMAIKSSQYFSIPINWSALISIDQHWSLLIGNRINNANLIGIYLHWSTTRGMTLSQSSPSIITASIITYPIGYMIWHYNPLWNILTFPSSSLITPLLLHTGCYMLSLPLVSLISELHLLPWTKNIEHFKWTFAHDSFY